AVAARLHALKGGTVDVMAEMTRTTLDIVITTLFGGAIAGDRREIASHVSAFMAGMGIIDPLDVFRVPDFVPRPWRRSRRRATAALRDVAKESLREMRRHGEARIDLVGQLLDARDPESAEGLSDALIVDSMVTFLGAGHETTAMALTWTLSILAAMPDMQE